jgi:PAS domain S-box-containing protein
MDNFGDASNTYQGNPNKRSSGPARQLPDSENIYRNLVENSITGIYIMQDWKYVFVNCKFAEMHGYSVEEMTGMDYFTLLHPDERETMKKYLSSRIETNQSGSARTVKRITRTGKTIICSVIGSSFMYNGKPAVMGNVLDITDAYLAEQRLKISEQKYKTLVESSLTGIYIIQNWKYVFVNKKYASMLGYDVGELIGKDYLSTVYPEDRGPVREAITKNAPDKKYVTAIIRRLTRDGELLYTQTTGAGIEFNEKPAIIGNALDVTQSYLAERKLVESEEKYRKVTENSLVGVYIIQDRKLVFINEVFARIHGYKVEELLGADHAIMIPPDEKEISLKRMEKREAGDTSLRESFHNRLKKNGEIIRCQFLTASIDYNGKPALIGNVLDITDKIKIEQELTLRAELLNMATDCIFLSDNDGNILFANNAACINHGYLSEEITKMNILDLNINDETLKAHNRELWKKGSLTFETTHIRKDKTEFPVEVHAQLITIGDKKMVLSVERDISERKKAQEQLIIADRLSTLGNLAGGFSHELNNPLTTILGYSQLLLRNKELPEKFRKDLENINSQSQRISAIIKNFIDFARGYASERVPVNINAAIKKVIELRGYELSRKNIAVELHLAENLPDIIADANQLQQVFLNLLMNSEYFMFQAHKKGILSFNSEFTGKSIMVTVSDDGPGIEPSKLSHIFDPFYTTKDTGIGTGMGLTIAYRIVTLHDGTMRVESSPEKGTSFIIELPAAK